MSAKGKSEVLKYIGLMLPGIREVKKHGKKGKHSVKDSFRTM